MRARLRAAGVLGNARASGASRWWAASGVWAWLALASGLLAPLALVLAFAAGASLDRPRAKAGALPALFGLVVGLLGTMHLLLVLSRWLKFLEAF